MADNESHLREIHGVSGLRENTQGAHANRTATLTERNEFIHIKVGVDDALMTPAQARRLARYLWKLARRVDAHVSPQPEGQP